MKHIARVREGGMVRRYHAEPYLLRTQTVAEHSWGVAVLILQFHPAPRAELLAAALTHDVQERLTGDVPHPAKRRWPALRAALTEAEQEAAFELGVQHDLTYDETLWLRACDMLDAALYLLDERRLGNTQADALFQRCVVALRDPAGETPPELLEYLTTLQRAFALAGGRTLPVTPLTTQAVS